MTDIPNLTPEMQAVLDDQTEIENLLEAFYHLDDGEEELWNGIAARTIRIYLASSRPRLEQYFKSLLMPIKGDNHEKKIVNFSLGTVPKLRKRKVDKWQKRLNGAVQMLKDFRWPSSRPTLTEIQDEIKNQGGLDSLDYKWMSMRSREARVEEGLRKAAREAQRDKEDAAKAEALDPKLTLDEYRRREAEKREEADRNEIEETLPTIVDELISTAEPVPIAGTWGDLEFFASRRGRLYRLTRNDKLELAATRM